MVDNTTENTKHWDSRTVIFPAVTAMQNSRKHVSNNVEKGARGHDYTAVLELPVHH
jgi:hypothetical protein